MENHTSISQRLHEALGSMIANMNPGERLLSEPKLARVLGVSRATLREAMRTYETQGVIIRKQGAGTYVMQQPPVIETGLEVLESIETLAKKIDLDVTMGELNIELRQATLDESLALELENGARVVQVSRIIQAKDRPAAYLIDILPEDVLDPAEIDVGFKGSVLDLLINRGTPTLSSSRCEINAVQATPAIARLLGIQRGDVLLRLVAWLYTASGQVIDYSFSYFLPGYFRFHVIRRVGNFSIGNSSLSK